MQENSYSVKITEAHIDEGGHANYLAQMKLTTDVHFSLRNYLGIGLEELQEKHNLFLVMRKRESVDYFKPLKLGDNVDILVSVRVSGKASLEFRCIFTHRGKKVTEMNWTMVLISTKNNRSQRIPQWMKSILHSHENY